MKKNYPVKQDLNLAQREQQSRQTKTTIIMALVLTAAIAVFCKFAVVDRLVDAREAEASAAAAEQRLEQAKEATEDYDEVLEEYRTYTMAYQAVTQGADPMECLDLLEGNVISRSLTSAFQMTDELISVEFSGVTLEEAAQIYAELMFSDLVAGVQVYTAATTEEEQSQGLVAATMTIRLATDEGEEAAS